VAGGFLAKAEESLASAESDYGARRYNSCARSAYYAAFQGAVAALMDAGIRPANRWEHRFVHSRMSLLARREKRFPRDLGKSLVAALDLRHLADYSEVMLGRRQASRSLEVARRLVNLAGGESHGDS